MNRYEQFGNTLREIRKTRKMTQSQVAEKAGMSLCEEVELEAGKRLPQAPTIRKLAGALKVLPEVLIMQLHKDLLKK